MVWATQTVPEDAKPYILDIGTGNGVLLNCLAEAGYDPSRMLGIDYSPGSIGLSSGVAKARGWDEISFEVVDFVGGEPSRLKGMKEGEGWDLLWVHTNIMDRYRY